MAAYRIEANKTPRKGALGPLKKMQTHTTIFGLSE